ncbi:MAG: hypothetical protein IPP94_01180 [Ignavibacteria bacterium]|nr:hypothetical protein [Ignavibacteria bacterium]
MEDLERHLRDLSDIRSIMERSSTFPSLSGLSGVSVGVVGLLGAALGGWLLGPESWNGALTGASYTAAATSEEAGPWWLSFFFIITISMSLSCAMTFSVRRARMLGADLWTPATKRLIGALAVPLALGGIWCVAVAWHGAPQLIPASMLVFYGLALMHAGVYAVPEIRWLGGLQAALGVVAAFWTGGGLLLWAAGFGVLHIVYGALMVKRYGR